MKRTLLLLAAAAVLIGAAAVSGVARPDAARGDTAPQKLVTTLGHGAVDAVPDVAVSSFGVRTTATTAVAAVAANADAMDGVLAALRRAGGDKLQTQQVSLYPRTNDDGTTTGFVAENTVSARTKVAGAGKLIDAAVAAGATTVEGPALDRSDRDALAREALKKAVADARAKAEALANAGGFEIGPVASVSENGAEPRPVYERAALQLAAAADTPVEAGTKEVTADVTVSFEIR
jgi:uncharacterized protein